MECTTKDFLKYLRDKNHLCALDWFTYLVRRCQDSFGTDEGINSDNLNAIGIVELVASDYNEDDFQQHIAVLDQLNQMELRVFPGQYGYAVFTITIIALIVFALHKLGKITAEVKKYIQDLTSVDAKIQFTGELVNEVKEEILPYYNAIPAPLSTSMLELLAAKYQPLIAERQRLDAHVYYFAEQKKFVNSMEEMLITSVGAGLARVMATTVWRGVIKDGLEEKLQGIARHIQSKKAFVQANDSGWSAFFFQKLNKMTGAVLGTPIFSAGEKSHGLNF